MAFDILDRAGYPEPAGFHTSGMTIGRGATAAEALENAMALQRSMAAKIGGNEAAARKATPVCTGVLDYFPDALLEVARVSKAGNDQHNPGQPLHWAKEKSMDEPDALLRHLIDRGKRDTDGQRHSAKVAWRALALLQREIDAEKTT
jgi:hypothetical protein